MTHAHRVWLRQPYARPIVLLESLQHFVESRARLTIITGAGISTPSGIGDYRDAAGAWKRAPPIQHDAFVRSEAVRQRYWARSFHGWPAFTRAQPNLAHQALADPALQGRIAGVITQNVDRLHQAAGQTNVIDLHGRLDRVICLDCGDYSGRIQMQHRLAETNAWLNSTDFTPAPDGDADLVIASEAIARIVVPPCLRCGGVLKPDVVFYGDSVPRGVVDAAYRLVDQSDGVLIIGTSLMVFSSYRFCRRANDNGLTMVAINDGRTRADELLAFKIAARCENVLPALVSRLRPPSQFCFESASP